ncbi:cell wall hydrolase [Croceibacterium sp. LX-88]|uniref:Cell wall hydrolase n=2 Tax=Croceibacterium selenioxidans TaxID=2838833 RepID=A0ABS5W6B9_9SPHN|nr:cell wall hydrolase [Croceibacterium selenioxidans]
MLTAIAGFVAMFGAGSTGAWAQEEALPIQEAVAVVAEAPAADEPRFVASEAVQPLDVQEFGEEAAARYRQATSLQELVGDMPIDAELSADMKCLAEAVYFEARGEPLDGQLAVAKVVINRSTSGLYPSDYCSVVTQRAQFSFVRGGRIPRADEGSAAWRRALAVAQIAHQDLWSCPADDAMYFHATYVKPGWASRKRQLARIDTHIFYR